MGVRSESPSPTSLRSSLPPPLSAAAYDMMKSNTVSVSLMSTTICPSSALTMFPFDWSALFSTSDSLLTYTLRTLMYWQHLNHFDSNNYFDGLKLTILSEYDPSHLFLHISQALKRPSIAYRILVGAPTQLHHGVTKWHYTTLLEAFFLAGGYPNS